MGEKLSHHEYEQGDHGEPEKPEIRYELEKPPAWYIQGSYVLDRIFAKDLARDVDVFIREGEEPPEIPDEKTLQVTRLSEDSYFPPLLGCYNTDRYLLTEKGVIMPVGFPERPESLELLSGRRLTLVDVIRGIKTSLRYELLVPKGLRRMWQKTLKRQFDPEWMEKMFFDSKDEVIKDLISNLEDETSEEERAQVRQEIERLLGRSLRN